MSMATLYVGRADDPLFSWEGGSWSGNTPRVLVEIESLGLFRCVEAQRLLEAPAYAGRQVDWGAVAARLKKSQIQEFLRDFYEEAPTRLLAMELIDSLDEDELYVLVACEEVV
jgi:hypothetical protein